MIFNLYALYQDKTWEVEQLDAPSVEEADKLAEPIILTASKTNPIEMYFFTQVEETPDDANH